MDEIAAAIRGLKETPAGPRAAAPGRGQVVAYTTREILAEERQVQEAARDVHQRKGLRLAGAAARAAAIRNTLSPEAYRRPCSQPVAGRLSETDDDSANSEAYRQDDGGVGQRDSEQVSERVLCVR
jgi:hypothetical protein